MSLQDQPSDYEVDLRPIPNGVVIAIVGELDVANVRYLRERLVEAVEDYPPTLRIDLSDVSFIDSSVVGLLVAMKRRVQEYGGHFSARCGEQALRALRIRGLVAYLNVEPGEPS